MKRITVLLADDNRVVRTEFRKLLELEDDLEVVGEAKNGLQAVAMAKKLHPELVLMDIAMPLLNGLQATRQILKATPATKVLMLSAHSDDVYVEEATKSGAVGYLLKQTALTVCAPRFGKSKRGTHSSARRFPAVFTKGAGKSRWIKADAWNRDNRQGPAVSFPGSGGRGRRTPEGRLLEARRKQVNSLVHPTTALGPGRQALPSVFSSRRQAQMLFPASPWRDPIVRAGTRSKPGCSASWC